MIDAVVSGSVCATEPSSFGAGLVDLTIAVGAMDGSAGFVIGFNSSGSRSIDVSRGVQSVVMNSSIPDFGTGSTRNSTKITIKTALGPDPATFTRQTVRLLNEKTGTKVTVNVSYNAATGTLTLTHAVNLGGRLHYLPIATVGTPYRLIISGVKDTAGNTNPDFSLSFLGCPALHHDGCLTVRRGSLRHTKIHRTVIVLGPYP